MDEMQVRRLLKDAYRVGFLIALIVGLLFVVSWVFGCGVLPIPGWCDVYWFTYRYPQGGTPQVLIVWGGPGDSGMGNPQLLQETLENPEIVRVRARLLEIDRISLGNLRNYDLVIVTKAKRISTARLKDFMEYVNTGGRLVWTGDAGTELGPRDNLLYEHERYEFDEDIPEWKWKEDRDFNATIGPWARRDKDKQVSFDLFLGLNYIGNYCEMRECHSDFPLVGQIEALERDHELVFGMRPNLPIYGDFAVTEEAEDTPAKRVLNLELGGVLVTTKGEKLETAYPFITTSQFGEKVAYYAIPPETFMEEGIVDVQGNPVKYTLFIENMYQGMVN